MSNLGCQFHPTARARRQPFPFRGEDRPAPIDHLRSSVATPMPWSTARRSSPGITQGRWLARLTAPGGGATSHTRGVVTSPHPPSNSHRPIRSPDLPSASDGSSGCASQRTALSCHTRRLSSSVPSALICRGRCPHRTEIDSTFLLNIDCLPPQPSSLSQMPIFTPFSGFGFTLRIAGYPRYIRVLRLPRSVFSWNACFRTVSEHQTHPTNRRISTSYLGLALTSVCFLSRSVFSP